MEIAKTGEKPQSHKMKGVLIKKHRVKKKPHTYGKTSVR